MPQGALYIVSTPIGNLEDITLRALRILKKSDTIFAEDTRRTRKLLSHYDIHVPLVCCNQRNQVVKGKFLLEKLEAGETISLVSDAGTPGISDPGGYFTRLAVDNGFEVIPVPGVSAVITALSVSGFPADSFTFYGFLPRIVSRRKALLEEVRRETRTIAIFESPRRLQATLDELLAVLGDRRAFLARELTKVFEELNWATLSVLLANFTGKEIKGEITLVIEGASARGDESTRGVIEAIKEYRSAGLRINDIARNIAREFGISKSESYKLCLQYEKSLERDNHL